MGKDRPKKLVAENQVFNIWFSDVEDKNGNRIQNYLTVSPKKTNRNLTGGIAIMPVFSNKAGLLKIYRPAIERDVWEIPRGFVEENESALDAARREIEEETGFHCAPETVESVGLIAPEAGIVGAFIEIFVARLSSGTPQSKAQPEFGHHEELRFFSLQEMKDLIVRKEILDPSTMLAMHYAFSK